MTTRIRAKPSFFRQIGRFLTRHSQPSTISKITELRAARTLSSSRAPSEPKVITAPILPPITFVDYSAEGDEPTDLALVALIPAELAALNLPHFISDAATSSQPSEAAPSCPINACFLSERPLTNKEMNDAELAELIPLELRKLNISPKKNRKKAASVTKKPLPDLSKLKKV